MRSELEREFSEFTIVASDQNSNIAGLFGLSELFGFGLSRFFHAGYGHDTRLLSPKWILFSQMNQNAHIDLNEIRTFSHEFQIISFLILGIQTMTVPDDFAESIGR